MNIIKNMTAGHSKIAEKSPVNLDVMDVLFDIAVGFGFWAWGYPVVGMVIVIVMEVVKWSVLYSLGKEEESG